MEEAKKPDRILVKFDQLQSGLNLARGENCPGNERVDLAQARGGLHFGAARGFLNLSPVSVNRFGWSKKFDFWALPGKAYV